MLTANSALVALRAVRLQLRHPSLVWGRNRHACAPFLTDRNGGRQERGCIGAVDIDATVAHVLFETPEAAATHGHGVRKFVQIELRMIARACVETELAHRAGTHQVAAMNA